MTSARQGRIEQVVDQHGVSGEKGHMWPKRRKDSIKTAKKKTVEAQEVVEEDTDRRCHPDSSQYGALEGPHPLAPNSSKEPQVKRTARSIQN